MAITDTGKTPSTAANNGRVPHPQKSMPKGEACTPKALGTPIKGFTGGGVRDARVGVKF